MTDSLESLRRQIDGAVDLGGVVRTMKALAASSITQYERAVRSLDDYAHTVELGLVACFRQADVGILPEEDGPTDQGPVGVFVFGSDQGLVGRFNDTLAESVGETLAAFPGKKSVWAVGERVHIRLADMNLAPEGLFPVPSSLAAITPLVGHILEQIETLQSQTPARATPVYLFHNRPLTRATYEPVSQRLLPFDQTWRRSLNRIPWPTHALPQALGDGTGSARSMVREYLFVSLFRAVIDSLASENGSRLAAMQRAEKNIAEVLETLNLTFHRLRQSAIDDELFDVITGYESLNKGGKA